MPKKRDTLTYELWDKGKKVYIGQTNDPEGREDEHRAEGKHFSSLKVTSPRVTEEGALRKEDEQLKAYQKGHGGQLPRYNKRKGG